MGVSGTQANPTASENQSPYLPQIMILAGALLFRWRLILGVSLIAGALLFSVSFLFKDSFKATTILMPPDHSGGGALSMLAGSGAANLPTGALSALSIKNPTDLYVGLLSSPSVEDMVIRDFDLQSVYRTKRLSDTRQKLERNALVSGDSKSGLIFVSAVDSDPKRAASLANDYIEAFNKMASTLAISEASGRRLFFEKQLAQTKDNLAQAEEDLRRIEQRTGIVQPESEQKALVGFGEDLRARIAAKNVELQSLKTYYSVESVQVQTAQHELDALRNEVSKMENSGNDRLFSSKASLTSSSLEYIRKMRDVRYNETLFELLVRNLEAAKMDEAREGVLLQTVSPASVPDRKDGPHRSLFLLIGLFLGCTLTVLWLISRDSVVRLWAQLLIASSIQSRQRS